MEKLRFPTLLLGLFTLTVQAETIVPTEWAKMFDITFSVELAEGASKVRLSSRVENDTYYLDGTFSEGFAAIVR